MTAHNEQSHLNLRCFKNPFTFACGSERVNPFAPEFLKLTLSAFDLAMSIFCLQRSKRGVETDGGWGAGPGGARVEQSHLDLNCLHRYWFGMQD